MAKREARRIRASLMRTTALQAVALAVMAAPAAAQIAATARPGGGQVTAGQASIGGNSTTTLITQKSQNAAINWQSYNIGSGETVQYKQPNAAAITLNTVTTPNPSQIFGKILANGQIIIVNQSGVVFAKGSQVDTAGLVVSSAGISTKDFMAGRLIFSQPGQAGAAISNAGNITVRQAGLAALVAPQVANSGVISATLGRVILGGATTHTLDLYGDGLVALNITGQVTQVSLGGKLVPALVTNTGTILAPGGTIVLTAAAADNVVTNLVSAGGTIAAPTLGTSTGRVLVQGIGGGISIDGDVTATGTASGSAGGQVVADATGTVSVASGALIDASGAAGGGVIAVGTTAARATGGASVHPTLTAQGVAIAAGARVQANATHAGAGGHVAVLSGGQTSQLGAVSAAGGPAGGHGGWVEISGRTVQFGGAIDAGAPNGRAGSIFIDPANIDIGVFSGTLSADTTDINSKQFAAFGGNIIIKADGTLSVLSALATGPRALSLQLEGDTGIFINGPLDAAGIPVGLKSTTGAITEDASGSITASSLAAQAGAIELPFQDTSTTVGTFSNLGDGPRTLQGVVVSLNADGRPLERSPETSDEISLAGLVATGGDVTLTVSGTSTNGSSTVPNGIVIDDGISGQDVVISTTGSVAGYTGDAIRQAGATISASGRSIPTNSGIIHEPGTVQIAAAAGDISLAGTVITATPTITIPSGSVTLTTQAGDITEADSGSINTGTLTGSAGGSGNPATPPSGSANFAITSGNTITKLDGFSTSGSFALEDDTGLTVLGTLTAGTGIVVGGPNESKAPTGILVIDGTVTAGAGISFSNDLGIAELAAGSILSTAGVTLTAGGGAIDQQAGATIAGNLASSAGKALALSAGGTTDFATFLPSAGIGTISGIAFGGTLQAGVLNEATGYAGLANLVATAGDITEGSAGSLRAGTLTGSAQGSGNVSLNPVAGNFVNLISDFSATGNIAVEDGPTLTLDKMTGGGTIGVTDGGALILTGASSAPGDITLSARLGIAEITGASLASTAGTVSLTAGGAIDQQAGATLSGGAALTTSIFLHALGSTDFGSFVSALGTVNGISFGGTLTAGTLTQAGYSGNAELVASSGEILEGATGSLRAATLFGSATGTASAADPEAGDALFGPAAGNSISLLSSFTATGNFALENATGFTIDTLSAGGSIAVSSPAAGSGPLVVAGAVTAPGNISLGNAAGITVDTGASVTSTLAGVTLTSSGGLITVQARSTLSAGEASSAGTAILLSAADGIGLSGTLVAGTLPQAGTTYTGLAALDTTNGNVSQGQLSSIFAGTLSGSVRSTAGSSATAGNVSLETALGNAIGTLSGFTAAGNFALEDDPGLTVGNLTAGGSVGINGPSGIGIAAPGILVISGAVKGGGAVSLSNALGIAELASGSVTSTAGGISLASSGGAITQAAGGSLGGAEASTAGTAVALSAGGTTDFDTYLPRAGFGTVHGLSLSGGLTGGLVSGTAYTGLVVLTASDGGILENTGASIRAGTLSGSATGSGAIAGNLLLNVGAGNVIATITGLTATGNVALEDDSGLTLGTLASGGTLSVAGPDASSNPGFAGVLAISGSVTAPGTITLSNALGIAELTGASVTSTGSGISLATAGAIAQQTGAGLASGEASSAGTGILLSAGGTTDFSRYLPASSLGTISGISFAGTLAAGTIAGGTYTGLADLTATAGGILEGAGSLRAGTLTGSSSTGNALLDPDFGNVVGTLGAFTTTGTLALEDDAGLTLTGRLQAASIDITSQQGAGAALPSGILVIDGAVTATGDITLANALGIAELAAGSVTSSGGGISLVSAKGGIVQQAGGVLDAAGASASGTSLAITAGGTTDFDTYLPRAGFGTVSGLTFSGLLTAGTLSHDAYTGLADLTAQKGNILEAASGTLQAGTLSGAGSGSAAHPPAGDADFGLSASNAVATVTGFTTTGDFTLEDGALVLGALSSGGSIAITSAPSASGILVIDGVVTAEKSISLQNALGIAELTGASVTSTLAGIALSTAGAFVQQTGSALTGDEAASAGNGISVQARGSTDFAAYLPASGLSTISGIAFAGTLTAGTENAGAYSGAAFLQTSAGDILEGTTGSLRAQSLTGTAAGSGEANAPQAGSALLDPASGNVLGTLTRFTASDNFALEDDSGLSIGALTAGGTVNITGPSAGSPTGVLVITQSISAPGSISLSNALGIAEMAGAGITSTLSGVTLTSSGGAIVQLAGATVSAGISAASGGLVSLSAGGTTNFGTLLPATGLGTVQGIDFAGTLQTSSGAGTSYQGTAALVATGGGIVEATTGRILAGTLTGSASGNAGFGVASGNSLSVLGSFSAGGSFVLENDTALTIAGPVSAGTGIDIFSPVQGSSAPGILVIDGSLTGTGTAAGGGTISLSNATGILETATGDVTASTALSLASGGAIVQLASGVLSATGANAAAIPGTVSLVAGGTTDFTPYAAFAQFGRVSGIALGGSLSTGATELRSGFVSGTATLIAKAGDITETAPTAAGATGTIDAGSLTAQAGTFGGTPFAIALDTDITGSAGNAGNHIGTLFGTDAAPFLASGDITIADNSTIFGRTGGGVIDLQGAMTAGGALLVSTYGADLVISQPGTVPISAGTSATFETINGPTETTGSSTFTFAGSILQESGSIEAESISLEAGYAVSQAAGATLDAAGEPSPSLSILAKGGGNVDGNAVFLNGMALGGTLEAANVSLTALEGNITEAAQGAGTDTGEIVATSLAATAATGTLTGAGIVALDTSSSGTSGNRVAGLATGSAGGAFSLVDGEALSVTGTVQAGLTATSPSALTLVAPAIDVTTGTLAIAPPAGTLPGILGLIADQFTFAAAGDVKTPSGIVALDLLDSPPGSTIFSVGTLAGDTVSAASLDNIRTGSGTLVLGSLDGTSVSPGNAVSGAWGLGIGGKVTAVDIDQPVNLAAGGAASVLGVFSNGSIASTGGITVGTLYGLAADGTALFSGPNAIATIGFSSGGTLYGLSSLQPGGASNAIALQLTDTVPLTLIGPVTALQGAVEISVTGTAGATPGLTLGSAAIAGSGNVSGTDIDLSAAGTITQLTGTLKAFGAANAVAAASTNGTIALQSTAGGISLGGVLLGQAATLNPQSAILLHAGKGDIAETGSALLAAGTLAAQASGNILLASGKNTISVIGPLASAAETLSLSGLVASGTTGIDFADTVGLTVADGALVSAFGPAGLSGPGTGSVSLSVFAGSLDLGVSSGATIAAAGNITLVAPKSIVQTGGLIFSGADVSLAAGTAQSAGDIVQAGATIMAAGNVSETATGTAAGTGNLLQTTLTTGQGSVIDAGQDVTLIAASGRFTQTGSSIAAGRSVTIDVADAITQSIGSTIAAAGTGSPSGVGSVVLVSTASSLSLAGTVSGGGTLLSTIFTPSATSVVMLDAADGITASGSILAGTLSAAAGANISLTGDNQISSIGSQTVSLPSTGAPATLTLFGLSAGGTGGIDVNDFASLAIGPDAGANAVISAARGGITIDEQGVAQTGTSTFIFGSLVIGGSGASSLLAAGAIDLIARGSILQDSGTVRSASNAVTLDSTTGSVIETGSSLSAATGVLIQAGLDIDLTATAIQAGTGVGMVAGGAVQMLGGTAIDAPNGSIGITAGTGITVDDSRISAGANATLLAGTSATGVGDITETGGSSISAGLAASLSSTQGAFTQTGSSLSGLQSVTLSFFGDVTSTDGQITSLGLKNPAGPGTLSITSSAGSIVSTGTLALLEATPSTGTILLSANGDIAADTVIAGTLAALAGGNILLAGTNRITDIASVDGFAGLTALGGSIDLADQQGLTVLPGATIQALGTAATINVSAASLLVDEATVTAAGDVTLSANGLLKQSGGLIQSNGGSIALSGGSVSQGPLSTIAAAESVSIHSDDGLVIDGTVQAGASQAGIFTGDLSLSAGSLGIEAGSGTLLAGTLAAFSTGLIDLGGAANAIAEIGAAGSLSGLSAQGAITVQDSQSLTVAAPVSGTGVVSFDVTAGDFIENGGIGITTAGPLSFDAAGAITIGGSIAGGATAIVAGTSVTELAGADISTKGSATIDAGSVITLDGNLSIAGAVRIEAGTDLVEGQTGTITIPAPATLMAPGSITLDGVVSVPGSLTVHAGSAFTEGATAIITAGATDITAATGSASLGGQLTTSGPLDITVGSFIDVAQTASIDASGAAQLSAGGAVTIEGALTATGPLGITAGTDVTENQGGTLTGGGITIAAGGAIDIESTLTALGTLSLTAGSSITEGQPATIASADTTLVAQTGSITIAGLLETSPTLRISAGTDFTETTTGTMTQNANAVEPVTGPATPVEVSVTAPGAITIDGSVIFPSPMIFAAGTSFTEGSSGIISGAFATDPVTISVTSGDAVIDGAIDIFAGLNITAGGGITLAGPVFSQGASLAAGGNVTLDDPLFVEGALTVTAGAGITEDTGASVSAILMDLTAKGGAVTIGGTLASDLATTISAGGAVMLDGVVSAPGSLVIQAGTGFSEAAGADIAAGSASIATTSGDALIGGPLTSLGLLAISAGGNITQDAAETMSAGTTASLMAPGTITLAGTVSAPRIAIGGPQTSDVVWNGATILTNSDLHGATSVINELNPLTHGQGVFVETRSFDQTGTSFVGPLSGSGATMQITIEGNGHAQFAALDAPATQLLLVLENGGFASGLIDVGGLNVFYTQGQTPSQAVNLYGTVGGRGGTAASATGFAHLFSNINYQLNGCPIQSINCVLLSPLVVPVVNPVNDYEEGTQRKRHLDDDALPNVGEEDY